MIYLIKRAKYAIFLASILLLGSCALQKNDGNRQKSYQAPARAWQSSLTQTYAAYRSSVISEVKYDLSIDLDQDKNEFNGAVRISFFLSKRHKGPLTIDFDSGVVESLIVNNVKDVPNYEKWFISIAGEKLRPGETNEIDIQFRRTYSKDGDGLHRYDDSKTGNTYLYTNFEPYNANKLFPHFDQPNIKAKYTLKVVAPKDWHVISAVREIKVDKGEAFSVWSFPETPLISSYIFPLHAGPYHVWMDRFQDVPLRLFARQELKQYVKIEDWFTSTKQSFAFFNQYFAYEYPFEKYDQVIVPDFHMGAMENLAAVTFSERYVSRGEKTEQLRLQLADVISHELAHMWFGNLVTMDWWNGLWLNESFATYMSSLQLAEASEFDSVWENFFARMKQWAYETDRLVTTHPIELPVATTDEAFANFDGITYGKGASVLKQLSHLIGEKKFRAGIVRYLQENAYGNAELNDFVGSIAAASGRDLQQWTDQWLMSAGLNAIRVEFACRDDQLTKLVLRQSVVSGEPIYRSQHIQIALFKDTPERMENLGVIATSYSGPATHVALNQHYACPDLVFPNYDDWAYVKVIFDRTSIATLQKSIAKFDDEGLRLAMWTAMWDSVIDYSLPLDEFIAFSIDKLGQESSAKIVRKVNRELVESFNYLNTFQLDTAGATSLRIEEFVWREFARAENYSDLKRLWLGTLIQVTHSREKLAALRKFLDRSSKDLGMYLNQDLRWDIVIQLNRFLFADYENLVEEESKRDISDRALIKLVVAQAIRPDDVIKSEWMQRFISRPDADKFVLQRAVMRSLFPSEQRDLHASFAQSFYDSLSSLESAASTRYLSEYVKSLTPQLCDERSQADMDAAIVAAQKKPDTALLKPLRIVRQLDERCVKIKRRALE